MSEDNEQKESLMSKALYAAYEVTGKMFGKESSWAKRLGFGAAALVLTAAVTYPVAGFIAGKVDNVETKLEEKVKGLNMTNVLSRMMKRELDNGWSPSAAFLQPIWFRDDMRAFQLGEHKVWKKAAMKLADVVIREGRMSGSRQKLNEARDALNFDRTGYHVFDIKSMGPRIRSAAEAYDEFDEKMGENRGFEPRIVTYEALMQDLAQLVGDEYTKMRKDIGLSSLFETGPGDEVTDEKTDYLRGHYYHALGMMNAVQGIVQAANEDFKPVLERQSSMGAAEAIEVAARDALGDKPFIVTRDTSIGFVGNTHIVGSMRQLIGIYAEVMVAFENLWNGFGGGNSASPFQPSTPQSQSAAPKPATHSK